MTTLLVTAIALIAGLMVTRAFKYFRLNLPDVTAFLIAGIVVGPYCLGHLNIEGLGFTSEKEILSLTHISNAALGFIAFSIGKEFRLSDLKTTGKQATVIGILQAVAATILVDIALISIHLIWGDAVLSLPSAITLGAIAAATAPASTMMVVRQYKAKGPLTNLLLPIVALDDAVGLILFSVSFGIAQALKGGALTLGAILLFPLLEIVGSLILGALLGILLTYLERLFFSNSNRLSMTIAVIILAIALSGLRIPLGTITLSFSPLLVCMMLGTVFCNLCSYSEDIMARADRWTAPLFALFFVISGAGLELSVLADFAMVAVGIIYIISRSAGKYLGTWGSAYMMGCEPNVRNYLGITLLPQEGVALGMALAATQLGGDDAVVIRNVVLFSVLIYELVGPVMTRLSLQKAGEIRPTEHHNTRSLVIEPSEAKKGN